MAMLTVMSTSEETAQARTLPAPWTPDDSTFGARLALIRQRMRWGNVAKAAKECGVPTDSWRNWEVDGREPHRLVTIAITIATRTGCDLDWLVYGPNRGAIKPIATDMWTEAHVVATVTAREASTSAENPLRPVRQTRPMNRPISRSAA